MTHGERSIDYFCIPPPLLHPHRTQKPTKAECGHPLPALSLYQAGIVPVYRGKFFWMHKHLCMITHD